MRKTQNIGLQRNMEFIKLSTYFPMLGYMLVALLARLIAWCPIGALWISPLGLGIKWLGILCPVLIITVVLPMRFSFAQAIMTAAQGGSFSIHQALRLTQYRRKLIASLRHALRILCWGLPFFLMLGWIFYIAVFVDVFAVIRLFTNFGDNAVSVLSAIVNFFTGVFGGQALQWAGGFVEGIFAVAGFTILLFLVFLWGIWRCSMYRYLWALEVSKSSSAHMRIRGLLRKRKWKQVACGLYNLFLWLPTLFFTLLIILSINKQVIELVSVFFETKSFESVIIPQGAVVLAVIGLLLHLLILPIRRSMTANLVSYIYQSNNK